MRRTVAAPACVLALALLLCPVTGALCQDDDLGLGDLLGGAGGGQLLGMLGGMGGGGLGAAAGGAKVIVSQPAMVVHGNFLYLATDGKLMKFDLDTLAKRRLASVLVEMYQQKGTAKGIENAVRFFLGVQSAAITAFASDGLVLGESELGVTTDLH